MSERKNLLNMLAFLRSQRSKGLLWDDSTAQKKAVVAIKEKMREKMQKGMRKSKAAASLSKRSFTIVTPDVVMRVIPTVELQNVPTDYGAMFLQGLRMSYVIAQSFSTSKGCVYVVRMNDRPEILVFTAHFFDRWKQRLETDQERLEIVANISGIYHDQYTKNNGEMFPVYDEDTLEQFFVLKEGVGLGYALPLPLQEDILFLDAKSRLKHKRSVLVIMNTFVTMDMVPEDQRLRIQYLFEKNSGGQ